MIDDWQCIRCETLNRRETLDTVPPRCAVCDTPRFYSQAEVDALLQQEAQRQQQRLASEREQLHQEQARLHAAQQQLTADRRRFEEEQKRHWVVGGGR